MIDKSRTHKVNTSWVCSNKSIPLATVAKDPEILLATNNFL